MARFFFADYFLESPEMQYSLADQLHCYDCRLVPAVQSAASAWFGRYTGRLELAGGEGMQGFGWWGGALCVLVLLAGIYGYNRLVFNRARVAEAWSGIDVQLKRRSSLIPQLVACLKAYMAHERDTLEDLVIRRGEAQAHERDGAAGRGPIEGQLSAALQRTFALVEGLSLIHI